MIKLLKKIKRYFYLRILGKKILQYFKNKYSLLTPEQREVLVYIERKNVKVYPYEFLDKYDSALVNVYFDNELRLYYIMHLNKRLFFPKNMPVETIKDMYRQLIKEQDDGSPHRYTDKDFTVENGDVVFDIGAAEGMFSLSVIEHAGKIVLFEPDSNWNNALEATFAPWKDKIQIINKFVSDTTSGNAIELDSVIELVANKSVFIKIDTEGCERSVLKGAERIFKSGAKLKLAICAYHRQNDESEIGEMLKKLNFNTHFTNGYMLRWYDPDFSPPFLRRGIIRAQLNKC